MSVIQPAQEAPVLLDLQPTSGKTSAMLDGKQYCILIVVAWSILRLWRKFRLHECNPRKNAVKRSSPRQHSESVTRDSRRWKQLSTNRFIRRFKTTIVLADILSDVILKRKNPVAALIKSSISKLTSMFVVVKTGIDFAPSLARLSVRLSYCHWNACAIEFSVAVHVDCRLRHRAASFIAALPKTLIEKSSSRSESSHRRTV